MKLTKLLFCFIFICFSIFPFIFLNRKSETSTSENRMLASFPNIIIEGKLNSDFINEFPVNLNNYLNDRFGFKNYFVELFNSINYRILHKRSSERGLVGKDDWIFYIDKNDGDNFSDFQKRNLFDNDGLRKTIQNIGNLNSWCEERNILFLVLVAPNKHNVYPEKYPFLRPSGRTRTDQLIKSLPDNLVDKVIFPQDELISLKDNYSEPIYYHNGTHWNKLGAYYASRLLVQKIRQYFPNIPNIDYKNYSYEDIGEDNHAFLFGINKLGDTITLRDVVPVDGWDKYYLYIKNEGRQGVITENTNKTLPKALVFRDSMFVTLEPFISSEFSSVEYVWDEGDKRNISYIEKVQPDVLIWEVCERYLGSLSYDFFGYDTFIEPKEHNSNHVAKATFDDGFKGSWQGDRLDIVDVQGQSFKKALATMGRNAFSSWFSVSPGEKWRFTATLNSESCNVSLWFGVHFQTRDQNGVYDDYSSVVSLYPGQSWTDLSGVWETPKNAFRARPLLVIESEDNFGVGLGTNFVIESQGSMNND